MLASLKGCSRVGGVELIAGEDEDDINAIVLEYLIWLYRRFWDPKFFCAVLDSLL